MNDDERLDAYFIKHIVYNEHVRPRGIRSRKYNTYKHFFSVHHASLSVLAKPVCIVYEYGRKRRALKDTFKRSD